MFFTTCIYLSDVPQSIGGFNEATTGWILMFFGAVGLAVNWIAGLDMVAFVPSLNPPVLPTGALLLRGIAQSASFVANHARVIAAAPHSKDLAASLDVSVYNIGIGLGATAGLPMVGIAGAVIIGAVLTTCLLHDPPHPWSPQHGLQSLQIA